MTKTQLERAKEIESELHDLRRALAKSIDRRIFEYTGGCGISYHEANDTYLAGLETEVKTYINKSISDRIKALQTEFDQL